jgi:hypothetical protein
MISQLVIKFLVIAPPNYFYFCWLRLPESSPLRPTPISTPGAHFGNREIAASAGPPPQKHAPGSRLEGNQKKESRLGRRLFSQNSIVKESCSGREKHTHRAMYANAAIAVSKWSRNQKVSIIKDSGRLSQPKRREGKERKMQMEQLFIH